MKDRTGLIHKIERFSLHDGPGIRTLVVMKGCPLRCRWCSSPYTQSSHSEILQIRTRCQGCGRCAAVCPHQAIAAGAVGTSVKTDRSRCRGCGACVASCPNQARELSGRRYTAEELFREVEKDAAFYRRSDGGITVGGGEPTMQAEFVGKFLSLCRSHFIHTAMETCAWTSWKTLESLLPGLDLVYIDLKHMAGDRHCAWTGQSNGRILENIRRAAQVCPLVIRVPVVPEFNDTVENISETARFAKNLGGRLLRLELLPYHRYGVHRYGELEREYNLEATEPPSDERMKALQAAVRSFGIAAEIGG